MSFSMSTFAGTTTGCNKCENVSKFEIPVNIIIKQTITFNDGSQIAVFYQKEGNVCKLYSKTDVTKYKERDLYRIKSTNFEIVNKVEGKCLMTKNTSDVIKLAKSLFRQIG